MEYNILIIGFGINQPETLQRKLALKNKTINTLVKSSFFDVAKALYYGNINTVIFSNYNQENDTIVYLKMLLHAFPRKNVIILWRGKNRENKNFLIQQGALNYLKEYDYENLQNTIEKDYNSVLNAPDPTDLTVAASKMLRALKDNYHIKKNTIGEISKKTGYSESTINQYIKKETGETVGKWITKLRINAAINLLINTDNPIKSITSEVGYNSEQGFIKAFKKMNGKTPTQYREDYYKKKEALNNGKKENTPQQTGKEKKKPEEPE